MRDDGEGDGDRQSERLSGTWVVGFHSTPEGQKWCDPWNFRKDHRRPIE